MREVRFIGRGEIAGRQERPLSIGIARRTGCKPMLDQIHQYRIEALCAAIFKIEIGFFAREPGDQRPCRIANQCKRLSRRIDQVALAAFHTQRIRARR